MNKENIFDFIFFNSEKHKKKTLNSNNNNTLKKKYQNCVIYVFKNCSQKYFSKTGLSFYLIFSLFDGTNLLVCSCMEVSEIIYFQF